MCTVSFVYFQNVLDERLKHTNSGVVLGAIHLFLHLTDDMPHLQQDVYDRIKCESTKKCVMSTFHYTVCTVLSYLAS